MDSPSEGFLFRPTLSPRSGLAGSCRPPSASHADVVAPTRATAQSAPTSAPLDSRTTSSTGTKCFW